MTAYTRKAPRSTRSASGSSNGTGAPRPLYDARMTEELSRIGLLLAGRGCEEPAPCQCGAARCAVPILAESHPDAHAVQLRASTDIQEPAQHFDYNTREMVSPYAGVGRPDRGCAGRKRPIASHGFWPWMMPMLARLLAACTAALIDGRHGKYADPERLRSVDRIARAANLDMREHWEGGIEFFGAITKKAMLAALTESCGPAAAEN
ncbi:MAG: hypothetical protein IPM41_06825 [Sphingomonadales bacterium]|nr:hypothetical protein [Sphingomonadales bacterium]